MTKDNNQFGYIIFKYGKMFILLGLLALIAIPMFEMMYLLGVKGIFDYFTKMITRTTGFNQYLAKAIVMFLMVPLLISLKWTFSFSSQKRKTGYSIIAVYLVIFYTAMFLLTKEQKFDFTTGKNIKYYAQTPEGLRYFDAPGFDPMYGIELKPVTRDIARSEALSKIPPKRIQSPSQFFNFATKEPLVWYYETTDGTLEFYNQPGFHPIYAIELMPVTPDVVKKYEKLITLQKEELMKNEEVKRQNIENENKLFEDKKKEEEKRNDEEKQKNENKDNLEMKSENNKSTPIAPSLLSPKSW